RCLFRVRQVTLLQRRLDMHRILRSHRGADLVDKLTALAAGLCCSFRADAMLLRERVSWRADHELGIAKIVVHLTPLRGTQVSLVRLQLEEIFASRLILTRGNLLPRRRKLGGSASCDRRDNCKQERAARDPPRA